MSSACAKLDFKDADVLLGKSSSVPNNCCDGSLRLSVDGLEDAPESDGDDTGYIGNFGSEELKANNTKLCSRYTLHPGDFSPRSSDEEEEEDDYEIALQRIFSDPALVTPVTLVSAMKGGREKNGLPPRKLNVKWAADVYDPPPSIVSHTRGKKQQKSKSREKESHKKNGKKGQKGGNSSRGGKDNKKQSRKNGRSADSYCGSSFLKTNLTKVHFSVAEAL